MSSSLLILYLVPMILQKQTLNLFLCLAYGALLKTILSITLLLAYPTHIWTLSTNPSWFYNFPSPRPRTSNSHLLPLNLLENNLPTSSSPSIHVETSCPLDPFPQDSPPETIIRHINFAYPELTPDKIIPSQRADPSLSLLIQDLETNFEENSPDPNGFYILNKTLLKLKDPKYPPSPENSTLVIPDSSLPNLISEFHILFGHLGVDRLTAILTSMYIAKLLNKYVKTLVLGCHQCQLSKYSNACLPPVSLPPILPFLFKFYL